MRHPFSTEEIRKIARKLKNGKSPGIDEIPTEYLKYAPEELYTEIARLLNQIAETGEEITELILGILSPLQKPLKTAGPLDHLRPIILLSIIRKVLTVSLIDRTWDRLKQHIPPQQSAYQGGRSTTEQVFAIKMLAEKAIISQDYTIHLLLLDMSKAFDTVNREKLFEILENTLEKDELHLLKILTKEPRIQVRVNKSNSDSFKTTVGILQGDALSALLFILYLSVILKNEDQIEGILSRPKYADDITYATRERNVIEQIKHDIPNQLAEGNLKVNNTKTEEFSIKTLIL